MRSAGNFSPEWGYLAPAPSFMRTARIVIVATAVGATAGAGVVLSLVDRPTAEPDKTAVAARAIVTSVQAAPSTATPPTVAAKAPPAAAIATTPPPPVNAAAASSVAAVKVTTAPPPTAAAAVPPAPTVATPSTAAAAPESSGPSEMTTGIAPTAAPGMAALSQVPPPTEAAPADARDEAIGAPEPEPAPPPKKVKHHVAEQDGASGKNKPLPSLGTVLRRLFSPDTKTSYYPSHGL